MTRTSRLDFVLDPDAFLAYQWDTKRKLFSLAEVCAPPSAVPIVYSAETHRGHRMDQDVTE